MKTPNGENPLVHGAQAHPRLRRLGALLLHRLPQPPPRLPQGLPREPRELGARRARCTARRQASAGLRAPSSPRSEASAKGAAIFPPPGGRGRLAEPEPAGRRAWAPGRSLKRYASAAGPSAGNIRTALPPAAGSDVLRPTCAPCRRPPPRRGFAPSWPSPQGRRFLGALSAEPRAAGEDRSDPWGEVGEGALAASTASQLGELLVAAVIAAGGDEVLRPSARFARASSFRPRRLRRLGRGRLRRAVVDHPVQRREASICANAQPRPLAAPYRRYEPHRPRPGDLLDLVEIAPCAAPIADAAAVGSAGEMPTGNCILARPPRSGLRPPGEGKRGRCTRPRGARVRLPSRAIVIERQPEMGAAEGQRVQGNVEKANGFTSQMNPVVLDCPIASAGVVALCQQQVTF